MKCYLLLLLLSTSLRFSLTRMKKKSSVSKCTITGLTSQAEETYTFTGFVIQFGKNDNDPLLLFRQNYLQSFESSVKHNVVIKNREEGNVLLMFAQNEQKETELILFTGRACEIVVKKFEQYTMLYVTYNTLFNNEIMLELKCVSNQCNNIAHKTNNCTSNVEKDNIYLNEANKRLPIWNEYTEILPVLQAKEKTYYEKAGLNMHWHILYNSIDKQKKEETEKKLEDYKQEIVRLQEKFPNTTETNKGNKQTFKSICSKISKKKTSNYELIRDKEVVCEDIELAEKFLIEIGEITRNYNQTKADEEMAYQEFWIEKSKIEKLTSYQFQSKLITGILKMK